jgi:hypothetical protein
VNEWLLLDRRERAKLPRENAHNPVLDSDRADMAAWA